MPFICGLVIRINGVFPPAESASRLRRGGENMAVLLLLSLTRRTGLVKGSLLRAGGLPMGCLDNWVGWGIFVFVRMLAAGVFCCWLHYMSVWEALFLIRLSLYEKVWFVLFALVGVVLSVLWGDTAIGFIAFFTGIVCVLLAAKGSQWNYIAGIVNCLAYAWVAYHGGLFGEVALFLGFYLPLQFAGFYFWRRRTQGDGVVLMDGLSLAWTLLIFAGSIVVVFAFGLFLSGLEGQATPYLDSFTSVFSVIAAILMLRRLREFWFLYFAVNIVSIFMWVYQLAEGNPYAATMLVMWSAYLVNSVYGIYVWYKATRSYGVAQGGGA